MPEWHNIAKLTEPSQAICTANIFALASPLRCQKLDFVKYPLNEISDAYLTMLLRVHPDAGVSGTVPQSGGTGYTGVTLDRPGLVGRDRDIFVRVGRHCCTLVDIGFTLIQ